MSVLLAIVKFIGIALLILLALLLLLLLVILFVPIRYQVEVSCYDQQLTVKAKVSYLLQIFRITAGYSMGHPVHYSGKLFWFTLFADEDSARKVARKTKKAEKKVAKAVKKVNKNIDEKADQKTEEVDHNEEVIEQRTAEAHHSKEVDTPRTQENNSNKEIVKQQSNPPSCMNDDYEDEDEWYEDSYGDIYEGSMLGSKKSKVSSSSGNKSRSSKGKKPKMKFSIRGFWESLKIKLKAFVARLKAFYQRFLKVKERGRLLKKLYDSEVTKRAFKKAKKQVCYLFRHLKPRIVKGSIHYGFHDPAITGEVLAGISMFYPVFGPHFEIVPDFFETCFEGEVTLKGHIRLIHVTVAAVTLFLDRAIKKTIKRFQRIIGGNE